MAEAQESADTPKVEPKICLTLEKEDETKYYFLIRKYTLLRKLMDSYCKVAKITRDKVIFVFHGLVLQENNPVNAYGMLDNDTIKVYETNPISKEAALIQKKNSPAA